MSAQIARRNARASVLQPLLFPPLHQVLGTAGPECLSVRPGAVIRGVREPVIGKVAGRQPASAFVSSMSNTSRNSLAARLDLST